MRDVVGDQNLLGGKFRMVEKLSDSKSLMVVFKKSIQKINLFGLRPPRRSLVVRNIYTFV